MLYLPKYELRREERNIMAVAYLGGGGERASRMRDGGVAFRPAGDCDDRLNDTLETDEWRLCG